MNLSPVIAGTMKWGSWGANFSPNDYIAMIENCISNGVTSFDHADIYGNYTVEEEFGKALSTMPSVRPAIQLITKCGIKPVSTNRPAHTIKHYNTGMQHIVESVENSLRNFNTDYIDVLLLHRPDPLMDPDEIAEVFTLLKVQGKVLDFGVSNFTPSQTSMILSRYPIVTNQLEISIVTLEPFLDGTLDQCVEKKLVPMGWSPLGGGNIFNSEEERDKRIIAVAQYLAQKYLVAPHQVLLAWLLKHPSGIIPVLGTARPQRVTEAMEATRVELTREEWFMLWRASTGREVD